MKSITVLLLLLCSTFSLSAKENDSFQSRISSIEDPRDSLTSEEEMWKRTMDRVDLWRAGGILTVTAGATSVFFGSLIAATDLTAGEFDNQSITVSSVLFWGGIGTIVGGSFMIAKGNRIKREFIKSISVVPEVNPFDDYYSGQMVVRF